MVDESFKVGLRFELDSDNLDKIVSDVKREIEDALRQAGKGGKQAGGSRSQALPTQATARSVKQTIDVSSGDLPRQIEKAVASGLENLTDDLQQVVRALHQLTGTLQRHKGAQEEAGARPAAKETKAQTVERQEQAKQSLANARKEEEASARLVEAKNKEAAAREEAARNVQKSAPEGGSSISAEDLAKAQKKAADALVEQAAAVKQAAKQAAAPPAGGPPSNRNPEKMAVAQERVAGYLRGGQARVDMANKALSGLFDEIGRIPGMIGKSRAEMAKMLNAPLRAEMSPQGVPQLRMPSGQVKVLTGTLRMVDGVFKGFGSVLGQRLTALEKGGRLKEIGRVGRRDEGRAISLLQKEIRSLTAGLPSMEQEGRPRKAVQKGGEFVLQVELTKEEQERLSTIETEVERLAEMNRLGHQRLAQDEKMKQKLASYGVEGVFSTGLAEDKAAKIKVTRQSKEEGGKITHIEMPIQTRALPSLGLGDQGGFARHAREGLVTQIASVRGGHEPTVKGFGEEELLKAGMYVRDGFKEFTVALASADLIPEIKEDQFLIDPKVVDMGMDEIKSTVVKRLAEGIVPGARLTNQQLLGTRGEGDLQKEVKFDLKGTEAVVERLETVFLDGVEGIQIVYKELNETVTGAKFAERSGIKGIGRQADLEGMGFAKGTGMVMSLEGLVKRQGLRTVAEMMAHSIAEATGKGAQEIADAIVEAAQQGGKTMGTVVREVAARYGAENFTGTMKVGGSLAKAAGGDLEVLSGKLAVARAPKEGQYGKMALKERYIDPAAMSALKSRMDTAHMAEQWEKNMEKVSAEHDDLIQSLMSMDDQIDLTTSKLKRIAPEDLKRLPAQGVSSVEDLKGTLLDPDLAEAFLLKLPGRGGEERLMRVPAAGGALGGRGSFQNDVGSILANKITKQVDRVVEQAAKVRGITGQAPLTEGSSAMKEAAEVTTKAIRDEVSAIRELGTSSEEGAERARKFLAAFQPLIDSLEGPVGLKYRRLNKEGKPVGRVETTRDKTAAEYVAGQKTPLQKVIAVQDILAERSAAITGAKGRQTQSVPQIGKIHTDADLLTKSMNIMGVTLDATGESADRAFTRLEKLENKLYDLLSEAATSRGKPERVEKRSIAAAAEAGVSYAPRGLAVQFRTDVTSELEEVGRLLQELGGPDVEAAKGALERMKAAQEVDLPSISRDTVLINEKDYRSLVKAYAKKLNITQDEAALRLERTGLAHRYPTTGEQSFSPARLQRVSDDVLPRGNFGIAGSMAVSSTDDLKTMLAPLEALRDQLIAVAKENNYQGEAAEEAGRKLRELSPVLDKLRMQFVAKALNLDFDGDRIEFHADMTEGAGRSIQTFAEEVSQGGASFRRALTEVLAEVTGTGGPGTSLELLDKMFANPKLAKGRPAGLQSSVPWNTDEGKLVFEATAHTAPKKSVGLLTDAFNSVLLSVQAGSEHLSQGMVAVIGQMMLGMNEALASKHGIGGAAGPMEFLNSLRKGQLGKIFEAMDAGEGFYGKLAQQNEKMAVRMRANLENIAGQEGPQGLMREIARQGFDVDVDFNDVDAAIDQIVEQINIKEVIYEMLSMIKENAISALTKEGVSYEEARGEVEASLRPQGKKGFIKGLNLKQIVGSEFPGYALTRRKAQEELKQVEDPREKARMALSAVVQKIGEQGVEVEAAEMPDPKNAAKSISKIAAVWIKRVLNDASANINLIPLSELQSMPGGADARGGFTRGRKTEGGAEGRILIPIENHKGFTDAIAALKALYAAGDAADPSELLKQASIIEKYLGVLSHEGVHKANKEYDQAIKNVNSTLLQAAGGLGEFRNEVVQFLTTMHTGVQKKRAKVEELQAAKAAGETTGTVDVRQRLKSGEFGLKATTMPIDDAIKAAKAEFARTIAEELLAYGAQPEAWKKVGFDKLPEALKQFVLEQVELLKAGSGDAGKVLRETSKARDAVRAVMNQSLRQAASPETAPDLSKELRSAQDNLLNLIDFPDVGKFRRGLEILKAHEELIIESGSVQPAAQLSKFLQKEGGGGLQPETPNLRGVRLSTGSIRLGKLDAEVKAINQAVLDGIADEGELEDLKDRAFAAARETHAELKRLKRNPTTNKEMGGIDPQREYIDQLREFQRNVAYSYSQKARKLQEDIMAMRRAGLTETPDFEALVDEFLGTVAQLHNYASSTLSITGKGKGTSAAYVSSDKGELLRGARELGLTPGPESFQNVMQSVAGGGAEGTSFLDRLQGPINETLAALQKGEDPLRTWGSLFRTMLQYPDEFRTDMVKVVEILSKFARLAGMPAGQFSEVANELTNVAGMAKEVAKAVKNIRIEGSPEEKIQAIMSALLGGTKLQKGVLAKGLGGEFADSIDAQMEAIHAKVAAHKKKLQELIATRGHQKLGGAGAQFEGLKFDVVDPDSGNVLQKFGADFVTSRGGQIVSTFQQIGAASKSTGAMLQSAFRRVVQWGFATGIIYGTVRAFREMVSVITNVETQMAELKKVMDTSITDFSALQDSASNMAQEFGVAIEQVLEGMVVYGQQGLEMSEVNERTRATLLAVNTTTLDTKEATEALASVMKVFSTEVGSSEGAVDAWAAVAAKHAISAEDLAIAVQRAGAAAKAAGIGFNDLLGITTAIGSVTRQSGKEVATGVKFMTQAIRRPAGQKALLGAGVQSQTETGAMRSTMDVLQDLSGRWDNLSSAQRLNIAQSIAGIRHYNQFLVLMENWQEVLDASANAQDSQGFATRKNAVAMETFSKQMQVLREGVKRVALDLGKVMLPAMKLVVDVAQKLLGVVNLLPDSLKALGVGGAAAFLAIHKGADLVLDTLGTFGGSKFRDGIEEVGLLGAAKAVPGKLKGSFKGVGSVLKNFGQGGTDTLLAGAKGMQGVMLDPKALAAAKAAGDLGAVAKAIDAVGAGFYKAKSAVMAFHKAATFATLTSVYGAIALAVVALVTAFATMRKSGKDVEDSLADQIGVIEDEISTLEKQEKNLRKVSHAWEEYSSAVKTAADPDKLSDAFESGDFKSPLVALKEYKDMVYETGVALAAMDPSSITGISESGEYIYQASAAMESLAGSAADAKKAAKAALQGDIVKAYADELKNAVGFWARLGEIATFGVIDNSALARLDAARDRVNELAALISNQTAQGLATNIGLQTELAGAVREELAARREVAEIANGIKKTLEAMPVFENFNLASAIITNKKNTEAARGAAQAGAFGREATGASVQMKMLAKNMGLGGIIGAESTASPDRFMQEMASKGLFLSKTNAPLESGDVTQVSAETAQKFLQKFGSAMQDAPVPEGAIQRARTIMTGFDSVTGELVHVLEDAVGDVPLILRDAGLSEADRKEIAEGYRLRQQDIQEEAEKSRRLLTIQAKGALAGIRIPAGGMPDLGPSMFRELTADQRVLGNLPDEMQRLSDIEKEMTVVQENYNEVMGEGAAIGEEAAMGLEKNVNVMGLQMRRLVASLQLEQFDLTYLGLIDKRMQELNISLEQAATAARDASIEEETRAELLRNTSGALAGLPVVPQLDFGKSLRELSGQERLQRDMGPGFSKTLARLAGVQGGYERSVQQTVDVRKQVADFEEMLSNLDEARGKLSDAQREALEVKTKKSLTGVTEDGQYVQKEIQKQGEAALSELQRQTPVMDNMLDFLEIIAGATSGDDDTKKSAEEKFKKVSEGIRSAKSKDLLKLLAAGGEDKSIKAFESSILGLVRKEVEGGFMTFYRPTEKLESTGAGVKFTSAERQAAFQEDVADYASVQERISQKSVEFGSDPDSLGADILAKLQNKSKTLLEKLVTEYPEVEAALRGQAEALAKREIQSKTQEALEQQAAKEETLRTQLIEARNAAIRSLGVAEQRSVAETQKAAKILATTEKFRLATATQDFANSMEQTVQEFAKAKMLSYTKTGSDLEGAFARVGQPGFRTQFENRRLELDKQGNRPMSLDEYQAREDAYRQIDTDEKEARIKEDQDVETAVLREQQSQAESIRSSIADAILSGQLAGDPGMESAAQGYMRQLTEDLATSEQADQRGSDLFFKGIPSLDKATGFLQSLQESARSQARAAEREFQMAINEPIVSRQDTQIGHQNTQISQLQQIVVNTGKMAAAGPGPVGATAAGAVAAAGVAGGPAAQQALVGGYTSEEMRARMLHAPMMLPGEKQLSLKSRPDVQKAVADAMGTGDGAVDLTAAMDRLENPEAYAPRMVLGGRNAQNQTPEFRAAIAREQEEQAWSVQTDLDAMAELQKMVGKKGAFKKYSMGDVAGLESTLGDAEVEFGGLPVIDKKIAEIEAKMAAIMTAARQGPRITDPVAGDLAKSEGVGYRAEFDALSAQKKGLMEKRDALTGPSGELGNLEMARIVAGAIWDSLTAAATGEAGGGAAAPYGKVRTVGPSNGNRLDGAVTAAETGNDARQSATATTDVSRREATAGTPAADRVQAEAAAGAGQSEALQKVAAAQETTNTLLSTLSEKGLTLPADFGSQIEEVGTSIVGRLSETLNVAVVNAPFDVNVAGLSDALTAAFRQSDLSSLGSAVRQQDTRLGVIESKIDPTGPAVPDLIAAAVAPLTETEQSTKSTLDKQTSRLDAVEKLLGTLPDFVALESDLSDSLQLVERLTPRVDKVEKDVAGLVTQVSSTAQELRTSLQELGAAVEKNRVAAETAIRTTNTTFADAEGRVTALERTVGELAGKASQALNIAQAANSKAQRTA